MDLTFRLVQKILGDNLIEEMAGQIISRGRNIWTVRTFMGYDGSGKRVCQNKTIHSRIKVLLAPDILFGPYVQRPGGGKIQAYLHATLDDASRLIPHAQFYTSQGLDACLDCLRQAIAARGLPVRLYMDNAKIYRGPLQTFVIDRVVSQEIREPRDEEGLRKRYKVEAEIARSFLPDDRASSRNNVVPVRCGFSRLRRSIRSASCGVIVRDCPRSCRACGARASKPPLR
jgi:hypothetical protein